MAASDYIEKVQSYYVAYYGRWADVAGLTFWTEALDEAGGDETAIINSFGTSQEYLDNYAAYIDAEGNITDPTGIITKVFNDMFDRDPDAAGLAFYLDLLESGESTFPEIVVDILNGATGTDKTIVDNKIAVAVDATDQLVANPDSVYGADQIAEAQAIVQSVDETPESVAAATTAANSFIQANIPGETFTLTTGTDVFQGTEHSDTFDGSTSNSLDANDVLTDPSTTDADVLNANISSYAAARTPTLVNIETLNIDGQFASTGLDFDNVIGTKMLNMSAGIAGGQATVANAAHTRVQEINSGANIGTLTVTPETSGTAGEVKVNPGSATTVTVGAAGSNGSDTFTIGTLAANTTLTLDGGAGGTDTFGVTLGGGTTNVTFGTASSIDVLNIASEGTTSNLLVLANANAITDVAGDDGITVSGDQALTIRGDMDAVVGAARTNGVAIQKAAGAGAVTLISNAGLTAASFFNRAQVDVFRIQDTATGQNITINEATKLELALNNGTQTYDVDNAGSTAIGAGVGTLNVSLVGDTTANATQTSFTTGAGVGTLIIDNSTRSSTFTALDTAATATTVDSVVVSGTKNFTVTGWTADATEVFSATQLSGNLTIDVAGATGVTVEGGSGTDSITGSTGNDIIRGNAGNDTITGEGGVDTISGGDGSDSFVYLRGLTPTTDRAQITDGSSSDNYQINTSNSGALVAPFTALVDGDGSASAFVADGAIVNADVSSALNIAAGGTIEVGNAADDVLIFNAGVANGIDGLYAALNAANTIIVENGGGAFAAGDQMVLAVENTTTNQIDVGVITEVGGDGFGVGSDTVTTLFEIDITGGLTAAQVAAQVDFIGLA